MAKRMASGFIGKIFDPHGYYLEGSAFDTTKLAGVSGRNVTIRFGDIGRFFRAKNREGYLYSEHLVFYPLAKNIRPIMVSKSYIYKFTKKELEQLGL